MSPVECQINVKKIQKVRRKTMQEKNEILESRNKELC